MSTWDPQLINKISWKKHISERLFVDLPEHPRRLQPAVINHDNFSPRSWWTKSSTQVQGCRFDPSTFLETKPQMVPRDLNIGFQVALIQGQIYNPEVVNLLQPKWIDCHFPIPPELPEDNWLRNYVAVVNLAKSNGMVPQNPKRLIEFSGTLHMIH